MSIEARPLPVFLGTALGVLVMLAVVSDVSKPERAESPKADAAEVSLVSLDERLASDGSLSVSDLAGAGWQKACLSRAAHPAPTGMEGCWPSAGEAGLGGSYLNVIDAGGQCRQWRTVRKIIDKRFDDTVCLPGPEVPDLTLVLKAKVLDIE